MTTTPDTIHVLHVDDEPGLLDIVATFLEREDDRIEVQTATDPDDGLEILSDRSVDCIVSDYDMPRQNGIEFLETVRGEFPDLPFILYTGKGSEEIAAEAISAGVSDYLQKESGTDQYSILSNRITNLVSQSRAEARVEQYAEAQELSEQYRQRLLDLMSDPNRSDDEKIDRLLALGCERLGVENGHLVMIDNVAGKHDVFSVYGSDVVREGVSDLSTTYCRKTIESDDILDVHHAGEQGWDDDSAYEEYELECYIGGKVTVDDTLFGTLCFVDSEPREPFTHNEKAFFNLLLQWCNQMVERRRRLNQAEAIFEHAQDAIFLIDVSNDETFRVRSVNRAYEEMTGLSTAEIRGQTPREILGDEQGGEVETRFRECVTERAPIKYEERLTLDGETFDFQTRLAPVIEEDTVVQIVGATRDITDRKKREQRYNAIFNQTYQFTGLLEPDGTLIEANQTALEFGGLDREDVIGKKMWDVDWFQHSEETQARAQNAVERAATGEFVRHELPVQGADREVIIDFSVRPITDDEGTVTQLVPEGRDITDRIETEQLLRDEQQFVQSVFQSLPDPIYTFDTEGHPIRWNEEFQTVTGYSDAEIEDMHVTEFVPADERETIAENFQAILDEGRSVTIESAFETKDGIRIPYEFTGGLLEAADGTIRGVTGIGRDISERTIYEERLKALNETANELVSAETRAEVATIGVETARNLLWLEANAIHLYDENAEGLVPVAATDSLYDLVGGPPTFTGDDSIAWRVYERGEILALDDVHEDTDIYNPDTPVQSELYLPLDEHGILIAASPSAKSFDERDVLLGEILAGALATALEQVERTEQLRASERELSEKNDRLEKFASVVSHDLRNPLTVAEGRLELAQQEYDGDHLAHVERAHDRMGALIEDLLALASAGEAVIDREPIDVATLATGCWPNVETAEATLVTDIERTVWADESRLKQVFENLIRNAIEHGGRDVTVTIGDLANGFYVEDDGSGIPETDRDDVFKSGYSTREDGTGFGLNIVKGIVEDHDWDVRVADGPRGGTRFEITDVDFVTT